MFGVTGQSMPSPHNRRMTPDRLKFRRLELGLTTRELALALRVPVEDIVRVEAGECDERTVANFATRIAALESRILDLETAFPTRSHASHMQRR